VKRELHPSLIFALQTKRRDSRLLIRLTGQYGESHRKEELLDLREYKIPVHIAVTNYPQLCLNVILRSMPNHFSLPNEILHAFVCNSSITDIFFLMINFQ